MDLKKKILLLVLAYTVSYITRINYGAIISEMVLSTGMTKAQLSLGVTGSFFTYGIGQIISGICADRYSPKKIVSMGFLITVAMNVILPFCTNHYQMLVIWCINGFAQAFMWPPIIKIMISTFSAEEYKNASVKVSFGSSIGTIIVYLVSPIIISAFSWKYVFWFSAFCGFIMLLIWNKADLESDSYCVKKSEKVNKINISGIFCPVMIFIFIAIVLQGMLRDGVTTWIPSYLSELYNMDNEISILSGAILPLFTILCFEIVSRLYQKKFKNPISCSSLVFSIGLLSALGLLLLAGKSFIGTMAFAALLIGSMHGVNLMLVCMIPPYFKKYGNVSTASGIINACTYVGSAISTYGIAVLSDKMGWNFTVLIWALIAMFGTLICVFSAKKFAEKI